MTQYQEQSPSQTDGAKDRAKDVGASAQQAGKQVASTAKEQAQQVSAEAKTQAKDLLQQGRSEITSQASTQQHRAAGSLRSLSDQLGSMSENASEPGLAQDLTRQVAD